MIKWDQRFLNLASVIADWSKDPSTQCGSVIVDSENRIVSLGYNGFPRGTSDKKEIYSDRDEKIRRVVHAEKNAILFAKCDLKNHTLYVVPMPPCSQCAGLIIQAGIKRVVTINPTDEMRKRWQKDFDTSQDMFIEAGVSITYYHSQEAYNEFIK